MKYEIKYKTVGYFDTYPKIGELVFVKTLNGVFRAKYNKFDWSDPSDEPYFQFKEGCDDHVIAWSYSNFE